MARIGRYTRVLALALAVCGVNGAFAGGECEEADPELGTGSLKIAFNFIGECSVTNYNDGPITIEWIRVYSSNGSVRASLNDVSIDPNETARFSFSGLNDRYHCVAGGFNAQFEHPWEVCESSEVASRTRLVLDALFNGSSTAESEGRSIARYCGGDR